MIKRDSRGLSFYQFESLLPYNLTQAIFTRRGGVSPQPWDSLNLGGTVGDDPANVEENLSKILDVAGYSRSALVQIYQVHSAEVIWAVKAIQGGIKGDAIITKAPGLLMLMRFADCVPLFFFDPIHQAAGIAHAGWQGTVKNVSGETIRAMGEMFGSRPTDIIAGIGPAIGPDHYLVREDVIAAIKAAFPEDWDGLLTEARDGVQLDLSKANCTAIKRAGVDKIELASICTGCNTQDWYSHRAEKGKTGRFAAVLGIKDR